MPKLIIGIKAGHELLNCIYSATRRIWICSPYIAPRYLERLAARRDLDIKIITRKCAENRPVFELAKRWGLELRVLKSLHAKLYIIDELAFIGSANLTEAGLEQNIELILSISKVRDAELFNELEKAFEILWSISITLNELTELEYH